MNLNIQNTYQDSNEICLIYINSFKTRFKKGNLIRVNSIENYTTESEFFGSFTAREKKDEIESFLFTSEFFLKLLVIPYTMFGIWQRKYNNKKERKNKYENIPKKQTKNPNYTGIIRNKRKFYRKFKK